MYHVFYIHSHITALVAKCVIDYESLDSEKVILVIHYSYFDFFDDKFLPHKKKIKCKEPYLRKKKHLSLGYLNKIQRFINEQIAKWTIPLKLGVSAFHLYAPQDRINFIRHSIFSKQCKSYYYIEEGTGSYLFEYPGEAERLQPSSFTKNLWPEASLYRNNHYYNFFPKYSGAYCFSHLAFQNYPKRVVMDLSDPAKNERRKTKCYLVFDDLFNYLERDEKLLSCYARSIQNLPDETFLVKFHPRQDRSERSILISFLKRNNLSYSILSDNTVLESELHSGGCIVYGFISSLLLYAKILNDSNLSFSLFYSLNDVFSSNDKKVSNKALKLYEQVGVIFFVKC